jgi:hypothetical protein
VAQKPVTTRNQSTTSANALFTEVNLIIAQNAAHMAQLDGIDIPPSPADRSIDSAPTMVSEILRAT